MIMWEHILSRMWRLSLTTAIRVAPRPISKFALGGAMERSNDLRDAAAVGPRAERHLFIVPRDRGTIDREVSLWMPMGDGIGDVDSDSVIHPVTLDNWVHPRDARSRDERRRGGTAADLPD